MWLLLIIAGLLAWRVLRRRARYRALVARFGEDAARRIVKRQIWQGQTVEMLLASRGKPVSADERVLKKTTRDVFKYAQQGRRAFALRVTLENGVVIGWDDKR